MRLLLLAAALALAACGAPKGPHARVPSNAWVDEDPETGDELVCQDERTTGTNMVKVVCRTQDEIDEERAAAMVWETNRRTERAKKF
jgi:predicted small lipoprotein YifL